MPIELVSGRSPLKRANDFATIAQAEQIALAYTDSLSKAVVSAMERELTAMATAHAAMVAAHNALLERVAALEATQAPATVSESA